MRTVTSRFGKSHFYQSFQCLILCFDSLLVSDFGLSRNLSLQRNEDLTEYVVTRYYRAPEIMLSSHEYSHDVDIWSAGCTLGEVMSGRIMFPG